MTLRMGELMHDQGDQVNDHDHHLGTLVGEVAVLPTLEAGDFVKCLISVGPPVTLKI